MIKLKSIFLFLILLTTTQAAFAEVCPYLNRENFERLDDALPCVNFTGTPNDTTSWDRMLIPALRQGVYGELARRNKIESACRAQVFANKVNDPAEMERIYNEMADRFVHYRPALQTLRLEGERDAQQTRMAYGPRGEPGETSARGVSEFRLGMREGERNQKRDQLIARIPYGFDPTIAEELRRLDAELPANFPQNQEQANEFRNRIYNAFARTTNAYIASTEHFQSLWRDTNCARQGSRGVDVIARDPFAVPASCPGGQRSGGTAANWQGCGCPAGYTSVGGTYAQEDGTWRAFSQSGSIQSLSEDIRNPSPEVQSMLRSTLTCNGDQYQADRENLTSFGIVAGLASLIPGVGPLAVLGVSAVVYGRQVMNSCYGGQATGFRVVNGQSCTNGMGLDSAVHAADSTDCAEDVLNLVGATAFSGAGSSARGVLNSFRAARAEGAALATAERTAANAFADAGGAAAREADNAAAAGATRLDDAGRAARRERPSTGPGRRQPSTAAAGNADNAGGAAARTADNAAETTAATARATETAAVRTTEDAASLAGRGPRGMPEHVPPSTEASRLVDSVRRNADIRLTPDQERLIMNESLERKREIDGLIGGRDNDIHSEQTLLNRYLEGEDLNGNPLDGTTVEERINAYITMRGFTGERARRLREELEILQRERTVLTRSKVNRDLDELQDVAEVRTVPCGDANGLNDTLAFHGSARCSVVRFTRAVENYCACGARGKLGSWAGPCANMVGDYLLPDELADRDALPGSSARNLRECKRIRIRPGTVVVHGGLRPTMSGHGGAAQIYLPSRGLAPYTGGRVGPMSTAGTAQTPDISRLVETAEIRTELGISNADINNAPTIEIIAVAPIHPSTELRAIYDSGRQCRQSGACSPAEIRRFNAEFDTYVRNNPGQVSTEQREQFNEWVEWMRGCRTLRDGSTAGSSFTNFDPSLPTCRR